MLSVFVFLSSKLWFTFLSIQISYVKSKLGFMISAKNQSKWYFSLWDLWPFEVFKIFENGGVFVLLLAGHECVLGEKKLTSSPLTMAPTIFVLYDVAIWYTLYFFTPPCLFRGLFINQTNHSAFYPELHDFDLVRVRRQKTLTFQINKIQKTFSFFIYT